MIGPTLLFLISVAIAAFAGSQPGGDDLLLIAAPCLVASGLLIISGLREKGKLARRVIVDGCNVMNWRNDFPSIEPVREVMKMLKAKGYDAGVVFDANAGHRMFGKYRSDRSLSRALHLSPDRVLVAPKGMSADPLILNTATRMGARVVSNERYRDLLKRFPKLGEPGFLITGGYRDNEVYLRLKQPPQAAPAPADARQPSTA